MDPKPDPKTPPPELVQARERFLELVAELRPELHRYCARLCGSVVEGEDVVQDTLAKAYYAIGQAPELPPLRPWLFRIAHNTAIDAVRRYEHRFVEPMAEVPEGPDGPGGAQVEETIDPEVVHLALSVFLDLPVAQRSIVILKGVLGCSLEEIVECTGASLPAVKAALVRGRANLRARAAQPESATPAWRMTDERERALLHRYASLFNARDWDSLRALVAEDCRLDLVSRAARRGPEVRGYFARYAGIPDLRVVPGTLDGRPVLAAYAPKDSPHPAYFILLDFVDGQVSHIRDFRYVTYVADEVAKGQAVFHPDA